MSCYGSGCEGLDSRVFVTDFAKAFIGFMVVAYMGVSENRRP